MLLNFAKAKEQAVFQHLNQIQTDLLASQMGLKKNFHSTRGDDMTINQKQKGNRFERQLAGMLRDYGYDCRRGQQFCGANGDADVEGLPFIHIEAKHVEKMRLYDWMEQAKRDSKGSGKLPAVFHKKNHAEVLVTMRFEDWMQLYKEFEASMKG